MDRMFEHRVDVNGVVLCCRGMSSSVLLGLILVLAQILGWIITAPLHLIPVIGTVIACCINGWPACWGQHIHYDLEFRGLRVTESRHYAWQHRWSYCSFGAVAVALELVPFFNLLFMWTNVVGAAMWVADKYEKHEAEIAKQQQGSVIGGSGDTSVASLYPSQRNPSSHVPSLESSEEARLLQSNTSISKDGYGSAVA
ncbi:hypothetical protein RO3G_08987 [Lichtheimia corymbifera JMRC:FSU:9682]|uniref:Uncharacterized protein n=1 Tax=Lichtheimia corymbifera JMRC:FSU:9682 TaxID=1263082 RepID=A0A068RQT6_9FUNG|nr:hypothetical protein RO3G_08987 [Lichtheimia corymbifera JMRC:FSU:9682]